MLKNGVETGRRSWQTGGGGLRSGARLVDRGGARGARGPRPGLADQGKVFDKGVGPVVGGGVVRGELGPTAGTGARPEARQAGGGAGPAALGAGAEQRLTAARGKAETGAKLG